MRETDEEFVIKKDGTPAAVLVSSDEFESWRETLALRFDPEFMAEIRRGLSALKQRDSRLYTLDELLTE